MYIEHFNALKKLIENHSINAQTLPCEWYNEQYDNLEESQGHRFPRVYIEFVQPLNWKTLGGPRRQAEATIRLHLAVHDEGDSRQVLLELGQGLADLPGIVCNYTFISEAVYPHKSHFVQKFSKSAKKGYSSFLFHIPR